MKLIALEEHFAFPSIFGAWAAVPTALEDLTANYGRGVVRERLVDFGARRLEEMDDQGIDVQVLSLTSPGVQNLPAAEAAVLAREANDLLAAAIAAHPERFDGFASLPTPDPDAAVEELHRSVEHLGLRAVMLNGRTGERNVDDPAFDELYAAAAALGTPIYLHPQVPQSTVSETYYSGIGDGFDQIFRSWGLGWHYETGVQLLRLIYAGVFDRHPDLQVIVGHWGELVLFYADRIQALDLQAHHLQRRLADYLRSNVFYTGSGILSPNYLRWTIETVGVDRVMYSTDYPFLVDADAKLLLGDGVARRFLQEADLSPADKEKIAHGNWERLTGATDTPGTAVGAASSSS